MNEKACLRGRTLLALGLLGTTAALHGQEVEVQVDVLGGMGKFNPELIADESQKVIQAAFAGGQWEDVALASDGSFYLCGTLDGSPVPFPVPASARGALVARLSPDARTITATHLLPRDFQNARRIATGADGSLAVAGTSEQGELAVAKLPNDLSEILWVQKVRGDEVASVAIAPDGSVLVCPQQYPFVSRIAADGRGLVPFGHDKEFRTDGANPAIHAAWWEGCGYPQAGYTRGVTYHRGGSGGVVALADGTFVLFTTNFLRHPGGGPDFDPMLLRFDGEGRILWCTNLLDGLPAKADQKNARLAYDPLRNELLLACTQHGHFSHNLATTPGAYRTPHDWITGDIMIGWIARVDPSNGQPRAATFFFPENPGGKTGGKKRANSLFPDAIAASPSGEIFVVGRSSYRFETTRHAFQWEGYSGAFLAAFSPDLSELRYASLIAAAGFELKPRALVVSRDGALNLGEAVALGGGKPVFPSSHAEVTNFLSPDRRGTGSYFNFTPSAPWQ